MSYSDNVKLLGLLACSRSIVSYSDNGKLLGLLKVNVVL